MVKNTKQKIRHISNGFTLVELLVAMAVFSVVIIAVIGIFLSGIGGTIRSANSQAAQESGRFIMESTAKEIRLGKINSADGVLVADMADASSGVVNGPYYSLNITNANNENVDYTFDNVNKTIARNSGVLNPGAIEASGAFYIYKIGVFQPRVVITLGLSSRNAEDKNRAVINLQTTVSSRAYTQ